jgi:hypothetical protein
MALNGSAVVGARGMRGNICRYGNVSRCAARRPGPASPGARPDSVPWRGAVTANPFAALAGYISGDAEFRSAAGVTVGIGATVNTIDDYNNYRAIDAKVRFYPSGTALRGFAVAATVGLSTARNSAATAFGREPERFTRPSIGTEFSYQWLLGRTARFVVVVGAGVKRMMGEEGSFDPVNIPLLPMARANIGYAF